jgi:hypothetical protein
MQVVKNDANLQAWLYIFNLSGALFIRYNKLLLLLLLRTIVIWNESRLAPLMQVVFFLSGVHVGSLLAG